MVAKKKYKLDIFNKVIPSIDSKDYALYDRLTDTEKKNFASVVVMRWGVNIEYNNPEMQRYYISSFNYHTNKHLFAMHKHPKLQWLMIACGSPKIDHFRRKWIGKTATKNKAKDDRKKILREMHPTYKDDDIELLSDIITKRELTQYKKDCGN